MPFAFDHRKYRLYRPVAMGESDATTRQKILEAALRRFAECGYAGTGVQEIVDDAGLTKPALYYYFENKAALFQALLDWAYDERYRVMLEAARNNNGTEARLAAILTAVFQVLTTHRELMRLAFATAFASRGEVPKEIQYLEKCERNFELIHQVVRDGLANGELDASFDSKQLAMGLYGLLTIYVLDWFVSGKTPLTREVAHEVVRLYLRGAGAK